MSKRTNFMRRICCKCHRKIYVDKMYYVRYPLISRLTFVCFSCFDDAEDIFTYGYVSDYINRKLSSQGDNND